MRMSLDAAWLDSPARVFPVTVDPSVEAFNSGGTTYAESPNDADYSGDVEIKAGTCGRRHQRGPVVHELRQRGVHAGP